MTRTVVIAGAGPAGLTAALELRTRSDMRVIVLEKDRQVGGISKTINYRGNRMDLGGHRFFSKSDWVMNWWQSVLPVADDALNGSNVTLTYQAKEHSLSVNGSANGQDTKVMLVRPRLSRIFYRRKFFDYPLKLSSQTVRSLGLPYTAAVGLSYARSCIAPRRPERSLEDFLINRFGRRLYLTFFKDYTEKVWGVPCAEISAQWGAQRIKALSVSKAVKHALLKPFKSRKDTAQKESETSLIERFLYPKLGPGQMWEEVAARVVAAGGEVHVGHRVSDVRRQGARIEGVTVVDEASGASRSYDCDYFVSTMPVKELAGLLRPEDPGVMQIASTLPYRDFITVGLLLRKMKATRGSSTANGKPPDNWIYVQEPDVKLGRIQLFNNWSPALVANPETIWLGLEYFCNEGDGLWSMQDAAFTDFAIGEFAKIGLAETSDVLDATVVRVPKAYPAYFGAYSDFGKVRSYLDSVPNLFPIGRNGMHRYNNQDHSMLAAKAAVDCMTSGAADKSALWAVNVEDEYHEEASAADGKS